MDHIDALLPSYINKYGESVPQFILDVIEVELYIPVPSFTIHRFGPLSRHDVKFHSTMKAVDVCQMGPGKSHSWEHVVFLRIISQSCEF